MTQDKSKKCYMRGKGISDAYNGSIINKLKPE